MKHHFSFWATPFGQTVVKAFGQHFGQHFWATPPFILGNTFGQHPQEIWATCFGNTPPLFGQHPPFFMVSFPIASTSRAARDPPQRSPPRCLILDASSDVSSQMRSTSCLLPDASSQMTKNIVSGFTLASYSQTDCIFNV